MRLIDNHDMTYIGDRVPVTKDVIPSWNGSTNFSFFYTNVKLWKVILSTSRFLHRKQRKQTSTPQEPISGFVMLKLCH